MNTLRLQLRFLLPLTLVLGIAAWLALPVMDRLTLRWFSRDLTTRAELITNTLSDSIADSIDDPEGRRLMALFNRAAKAERLLAIGLCTRDDKLMRHTDNYPADLGCAEARSVAGQRSPVIRIAGGPVHVGIHEVMSEAGPVADLVVLQDFSFIARRSEDTQKYLVILIAALGAVIALITVVVAQLSWRGWVSGARALLRGEGLIRPIAPSGELAPFAADLRVRLRDLEDEYRRSLGPDTLWNADRLRSLLGTQLRGDEVIVVSNREPYIHERAAGRDIVSAPGERSGDVEPVMRPAQGHGSRTAAAPRIARRYARPDAGSAGRRRLRAAPGLSRRRRSKATTTASPMRAAVAALPYRPFDRCFASRIGRPIAR